jgi:hypothetical protein
MSHRRCAAALALLALLPTTARAQHLASRIAAAGDGAVTFSYASRPGACGDGRSLYIAGLGAHGGTFIFSPDGNGLFSGWTDETATFAGCVPGPARVRLSIRDGRVSALRPAVGGRSAAPAGTTDLGTVGAAEAATYLLDLARTGPESVCTAALVAAALADSVRIATPLLAIARDRTLAPTNREHALKWVGWTAGMEGSTTADAGVRAIAADETDVPEVRERAIRVVAHPAGDAFLRDLYRRLTATSLKERVIRVLGESPLPAPANVEWLERLARTESESQSLRERAIRVLGELGETGRLRALYAGLSSDELKDRAVRVAADGDKDGGPDAATIAWIKGLAAAPSEPMAARDRAIRVLGEQGEVPYLRDLYPRLDRPDLQDRVLRVIGEVSGEENQRFLWTVVRDVRQPTERRDHALRSLAAAGVPTAALVAVYDSLPSRELKERLIGLLSERGDAAAREKLGAIARQDPDADLRRRAQRRLGGR